MFPISEWVSYYYLCLFGGFISFERILLLSRAGRERHHVTCDHCLGPVRPFQPDCSTSGLGTTSAVCEGHLPSIIIETMFLLMEEEGELTLENCCATTIELYFVLINVQC